jgi:hypothetical protein
MAQAANYPTSPGGGFGNIAAAPSTYTPPRVQPATGTTALGNALLGVGAPLPSSAFVGARPAATAGVGLGGYPMGGLPRNPTFATQPNMSAAVAMGNALLNPPKPQPRPQMPQQITLASVPAQPQQPQQQPQQQTGGTIDVSQWSPADAAAAFANYYEDPAYDRPTDDAGNFTPTLGWSDPSAWLPDLDAIAAAERYFVPQS